MALKHLSNADFEFDSILINNKKVGVLLIHKATNQTVMFKKNDYIRIGSYTKRLNEYPALQAQLWDRIRNARFEEQYAKQDMMLSEVLQLVDYSVYFDILGIPQPTNQDGIAYYLKEEGIIVKQDNGLFAITNLGAILLAKRLSDFSRISRKAVRIVQYNGNNRLDMLKDNVMGSGYAIGFENLIKFIEALIPTQASFGAEHLLSDKEAARRYLAEEWGQTLPSYEPLYEQISEDVFRVNIGACKRQGISKEDLFEAFAAGLPKDRAEGEMLFGKYIAEAESLAMQGLASFSPAEWHGFLSEYLAKGIRPVHHSESYREKEKPAYRIVLAENIDKLRPDL